MEERETPTDEHPAKAPAYILLATITWIHRYTYHRILTDASIHLTMECMVIWDGLDPLLELLHPSVNVITTVNSVSISVCYV